MAEGIHRVLQSGYWINTVFPAFKAKYPIDAGKIEKEQAGNKRPLPASNFAKGVVEEIRKHPLSPPPSTNFSIYEEPVVFLHSARGGVEYQEEQTKYFGVAACDLNGVKADDPLTKWDTYKARAKANGLETVDWHHCHTYAEIQNLLNLITTHPKKTGILNLESIVSEGISPNIVAEMIDTTLGRDSILAIITLGWMDGIDWSALSRHVFQLEFFLNDPPPNGDWQGIPDAELCRQLAWHARENCGVKKLTMVCGSYSAAHYNPYARDVTAAEYKMAIKSAGERFGGIYLGDTNGSNYSQWAQ